ncbi:hypothetical protein GJAV_G00226500 [Gymnothorax javanicus]|nr:hypothetical protein GJAV_G00226500 [Gymnothorax javanicus]
MFRNSLKMFLSGGKSNRKNRHSGGSSTDSECTLEGEYPVTEGMQHIRIMEGVSRSLPSSPLLTHQALNMRLQPMKRLTGEENPALGPPPSVDEAANTLMTRLGFLLGDKVSEGPTGAQYSMEEQDDGQGLSGTQRISPCSTLTSSTASPPPSSPCSTLPPAAREFWEQGLPLRLRVQPHLHTGKPGQWDYCHSDQLFGARGAQWEAQ